MKGRTILTVVCVVALAATPAAAAASPPPPPPVLKGRTIAVAETTAFTTVRLPRPIHIRDGWSITPHGRGRLRGFVLTQVGERLMDTPTYAMVFPGYCNTSGCGEPEWQGGGFGFLTGTDGSWILPAGTYRMYVVADSARVQMELEIDGYRGRTTIAGRRPAAVDFESFRAHPVSTPDGTVWVGGGFSEMGGGERGFASMHMWARRDNPAPTPYLFGDCVYREREHPAPEHAFAPGCPGSGQRPYPLIWLDSRGYVYSATAMDPVPYGIGGHSLTPWTEFAGGAAVWLPLTEALP